MSSSVYIPTSSGGGGFTPPESTSVKTASYTIPVGKFAKVTDSFGNLSLNGSLIAKLNYDYTRSAPTSTIYSDAIQAPDHDFSILTTTTTASNISNQSILYYGLISYTVTPVINIGIGPIAIGNLAANFLGTRSVNMEPLFGYQGNYPNASAQYSVFGYVLYTFRNAGTVTSNIKLFKKNLNSFYVPSGTVLAGDKYLVEEYTI